MSPCQRPRWHLFNLSNFKADVPVAARCEGGEPIYLRPRLVAKLSSCSWPWGAVFTVWLVRRCHYSCLWQRVRGQGVGVEPGGEGWSLRGKGGCDDEWSELALIAAVASSWLSELLLPLNVPAPCHNPFRVTLEVSRQVGQWEFCPKGDTEFCCYI